MEAVKNFGCLPCDCSGNSCGKDPSFQGIKLEWPELVGAKQSYATAVIEKENPLVTVIPLPEGAVGLTDLCCNRVYLFVTKLGGVVIQVPRVG
ncbi:Wound-induced proteinase inhibitor 1 like [Actinidia chinensis var. chinensis]|uniref:Wound-induced proteinase inhibitor 1 like n=1 Tax=Actinidia chinensis var. chinensis TaxID=1590841 RepID=A0A2R6QKY3_ACTCC|nr:Wound-induced proteinase inhibitor 1 like [Actinidia chinensis var. chinensis]